MLHSDVQDNAFPKNNGNDRHIDTSNIFQEGQEDSVVMSSHFSTATFSPDHSFQDFVFTMHHPHHRAGSTKPSHSDDTNDEEDDEEADDDQSDPASNHNAAGPFLSKDEVKNFIIEWSIKENKHFKVSKSSLRRYEVACAMPPSSCPFKVSVYHSRKKCAWSVKHFIPHQCSSIENSFKKAPVQWIVEKYKSMMALNPFNTGEIQPCDVQNVIKAALNIDVPYSSAWKCVSIINKQRRTDTLECPLASSATGDSVQHVRRRPGRPKKTASSALMLGPAQYSPFPVATDASSSSASFYLELREEAEEDEPEDNLIHSIEQPVVDEKENTEYSFVRVPQPKRQPGRPKKIKVDNSASNDKVTPNIQAQTLL